MSVEGRLTANSASSNEEEEEKKTEERKEELLIDAMHWGFHEPNMFLLNGRLETLAQTKSFKGLVESQRCVVRERRGLGSSERVLRVAGESELRESALLHPSQRQGTTYVSGWTVQGRERGREWGDPEVLCATDNRKHWSDLRDPPQNASDPE